MTKRRGDETKKRIYAGASIQAAQTLTRWYRGELSVGSSIAAESGERETDEKGLDEQILVLAAQRRKTRG